MARDAGWAVLYVVLSVQNLVLKGMCNQKYINFQAEYRVLAVGSVKLGADEPNL